MDYAIHPCIHGKNGTKSDTGLEKMKTIAILEFNANIGDRMVRSPYSSNHIELDTDACI